LLLSIQVEAIRGYNEMKESLKDFLKKFADEGKIVTQEDIQEFFATMKATKRPRVEIPEFCR
jgi:E3 ubiquitin-protein ligase UBR7